MFWLYCGSWFLLWGVISIKNENRIKGLWKPILLIIIVATVFVLSSIYGFGDKLGSLQDWINTLGPLGPIVFVLIYIGATVSAIPGTILGVAAGIIFGSILGVILVSISSTIGACICFLIARYFARNAVERWFSKNEKFQRLDELTEIHGAIIIAITRLIPLFPFNLLNYGFGLTRVSFKTYVFWSWLCMIPGSILFVVGGDVFTQFIKYGKISWELITIIVIFSVILAFIGRYSYQELKKSKRN